MCPQWNRSSSWGSTCTKLAACLLLIALVYLILLQESSSQHKVRSLRWGPLNVRHQTKIWFISSFCKSIKYFAPFPGAARDTVPDMGPVAGLWECGAVWRGQRAERWSSYYCHWNLWSRHSGKGCFQIVTLFIFSILYGIMKIKGLTYLKYLDHLRDFHFKYGKKHVNQSNESQCILLLFFNWYIFNLFYF